MSRPHTRIGNQGIRLERISVRCYAHKDISEIASSIETAILNYPEGFTFGFRSVGRHRPRETTWVVTIALSRATRFWWRDTHCTTVVWRWLITVADRTHTRASQSSVSTHTRASVRANVADNESLVVVVLVVQIWIFDGRKPRGVHTTRRPRSWLIEK